MMRWSCLFAAVLAFSLSQYPAAAGGSPVLSSLLPRGGQRGTQVAVTFKGARLDKAIGLIFDRPGIELTRLEQVDAAQVKATLAIAADAPIGLHRLWMHTAHGVTNVKLFSVGTLPEVSESEPNSNRSAAQTIQPPITINGTITAEDVDCFAVQARKGETLAFEVEAMRLGDTLFDPRLAVYDPAGNEFVVADDTPLVRQDCAGVVTFPADGTYVIELREAAYGGSNDSHYRLHLGDFPRPLACLPAGGKAGTEIDVRWLEDLTAGTQKIILPATLPAEFAILPQRGERIAPSPVPFQISAFETVIEVEPNDDHAHATPLPVPGGVSGVIGSERDVDCFVFEGKKDQVLEARVFARQLRSGLDPVLDVCRPGGAMIASNDDSGGPDSRVRVTLPEDGKYILQVRDHLFRHGPAFTYFLEIGPVRPELTLSIPRGLQRVDAKLAVPAGNRAALLITANRRDFSGPLVFSAADLPPGVTLHADTMHEAVTQIPLVFEAAANAAPAGTMVDLIARHADPKRVIEGHLRHTIDLAEVQANVVVYSTVVDRLAVAVTEPAPFTIEIVEPKVPIVRRGIMELPVRLERKGDFKGAVDVRMLWNPPGIGSGTLKLAPDQTQGALHLDANENARVGKWKIAVTATADLGGGALETASQLATLEVAEPFVEFALEPARTELGRPVDLVVQVTPKTPFEGEAKVELVNLPAKVATTQTAVTAQSTQVRYHLEVPASAPAGRHRGLFVQAVMTRDGQPVVHRSATSELILDKPLPPVDPKVEAERIAARKKAQEERERRRAERIAAAARRRAERDAARRQSEPPAATRSATQASAAE